ncbi:MAG: hypothetical protein B7733_26085 [Myxococcales bacterium FL481]|nr:MAG: hypothetical protein B7733_26085 [Myxococcales bacterium FL481]
MKHASSMILVAAIAACDPMPADPVPTSPTPDDSAQLESRSGCYRENETTQMFRLLGKNAGWELVSATPMNGWTTYHTQGMLKIGDAFYVSSVEVETRTEKNGTPTDALYDWSIDRSAGSGRGYVSKFNAAGDLLAQVEITDGDIYHPGGMDFDGKHIWVPVAEYRPNSASNIYRVDPDSLQAELVFSEDDHIGGVVYNRRRGTVHGVSWGSRRLYKWRKKGWGEWAGYRSNWQPNTAAYIDYQDCHYQGVEYMLCGGVNGYDSPLGKFAFGGLELVDLRTARPDHQIPVNHFVDDGEGVNPTLSLAHNAFWAEPHGEGMRIYFMTERDNHADLLTYQVTPWINR